MKEISEKNIDKYIRGLYLAVISTLLYIFILLGKDEMGVGEAWVEWLFMFPALIFPLMFEAVLSTRFFLFVLTFFPLAFLGIFWTSYVDANSLIFFFYGLVIFLSTPVSHFLIKAFLLTNKKLVISILGLSLIFLVGFSLVKTNKKIIDRDKNLEISLVYNNLRNCGNSLSLEEFENECKRMKRMIDESGGRFRGLEEICFNQLNSKKTTGYVEPSFSHYGTGRCD